jgi:tight adherence protein B
MKRSTPTDNLLKSSGVPTNRLTLWLADNIPGLDGLQLLLMRAGSDQTAAHVFNVTLGLALALGLTIWLATNYIILGVLVFGLTIALPLLRLIVMASRRKALFTEQLPDALDFMSRALRAGHSLSIAIGMVSDELPDPIGGEFKTVFDEVNFGISFQEALSKMPQRIDSSDLNFFVVAVLIQRETGGNLSDLLHSLAGTVRERLKLKGRVRVLAAEGKYSGIILGTLPFFMAGALTALNPTYMAILWDTKAGNQLVYGALCAMAFGFAWMWKIAQIKV